MSRVLDIVLMCNLMEEGVDDRVAGLDELNEWLRRWSNGQLVRVDDYSVGVKAMQAVVAVGAFNHLNVDEFLSAAKNATWTYPELVRIGIKDEEWEKFRMFTLDGPENG